MGDAWGWARKVRGCLPSVKAWGGGRGSVMKYLRTPREGQRRPRENSEDPAKGMGKGAHKQVKTTPSKMVTKCVIEV